MNAPLIPAFTEGRQCTYDERTLLALPVRLGGLGIINLAAMSNDECNYSIQDTSPLSDAIISQKIKLPENLAEMNKRCTEEIRKSRRDKQLKRLEDLRLRMTREQSKIT